MSESVVLKSTQVSRERKRFPTRCRQVVRTITAQLNGGPLGGTASFQRYTTELRTYTTLGTLGGDAPGAST